MNFMHEANAIAARLRSRPKAARQTPRWPDMPPAGKRQTDLTPPQREILEFMREFFLENDQTPPVSIVAQRFGLTVNGAHWHLAEMGRKGALEKNAAGRWRFARGAR